MSIERKIKSGIESIGSFDLESQIEIKATNEGISIAIGETLAKRVVEKVRQEKTAEWTWLLVSPSLKPTLSMEIVPNGLTFSVNRQVYNPEAPKRRKEENLVTFGAFDLPELIDNRGSLPQISLWLRALRESLTEEIAAGDPNEFPKASLMTILLLKTARALNEEKMAETNCELIEQTRVSLDKI